MKNEILSLKGIISKIGYCIDSQDCIANVQLYKNAAVKDVQITSLYVLQN